MLNLFSKKSFLAFAMFLIANTAFAALTAEEYLGSFSTDEYCYCPSRCNRLYIGGFGGGIYSNSTNLRQTGVAFFIEADGGPLSVDARGRSNSTSSGFGGAQIGVEWAESPFYIGYSDWSITTGAEIEAYFYSQTKRGDLFNPTERLDEHDFLDTFPMDLQVYLVNVVLTINNSFLGKFSPYVGGGVGLANIFIHEADSLQVEPPEPGVNHFDSKRSNRSWTFAAQAKVGLRYNVWEKFHVFGEYRFLYLDSSDFLFGSTVAPGHPPTTTWDVSIKGTCNNAFSFGVQYDL